MAENILIVAIVLICLLLLVRHFYRQVKGKGCGCGAGNDQAPLQQDLPDLRSGPPKPSQENNHRQPGPNVRR